MSVSLLNTFVNKRSTLLGVGPMSLNCIDATIELANQFNVPLMLIASRRQIDSKEFGGGYVNNWTTKEFSDYVIDNDKNGKIMLARDHGGPWQNDQEIKQNLSLGRAMESAKRSFKEDIDSGFQILHIDPSIEIFGKSDFNTMIERVFELYEFCWEYAQKNNKKIIFEIGTEEQSGSTNTQEELILTLEKMKQFCSTKSIPYPSFVVVQTGTKVMETQNVGSLDSPIRVKDVIPPEIQIPKMIEICKKYNVMLKQHNTDYLSDESLKWLPRVGIHAVNVAPEYGVAETLALVDILKQYKLKNLLEEFLKISYDSHKWQKWMLPDTNKTDFEKAIISGHYVFSNKKFLQLKKQISEYFINQDIDIDIFLKNQVKSSIMRYLTNLNLV